jgi:hypothetical protein
MCRILILGLLLAATCGCGVGTPTGQSKPVVEIKKEPAEVYDKVAPMPREVNR